MATEAYKLTIGGIQFGAWMQNEIFYLYDNGEGDDPWLVASNLVNDWYAHCGVPWLGLAPAEYGMQWLRAIRISTGGGKSWTREFPGGSATGSLGTQASSLSTAPIIKLYPSAGFRTQGRLFLMAPAETMLINNVYQATYKTAVTTFITAARLFTVSGRTYQMAIHSPKLSQTVSVDSAALGNIIGNIGRRRVPR